MSEQVTDNPVTRTRALGVEPADLTNWTTAIGYDDPFAGLRDLSAGTQTASAATQSSAAIEDDDMFGDVELVSWEPTVAKAQSDPARKPYEDRKTQLERALERSKVQCWGSDAVSAELSDAEMAANQAGASFSVKESDYEALGRALDSFDDAIKVLDDAISEKIHKPSFDQSLMKGSGAIDVARGLPIVDATAESARQSMEAFFAQAIRSAASGQFSDASTYLENALGHADLISQRRVSTREELLDRQLELEDRLADLRARAEAQLNPSKSIARGLETAASHQQAAEAAIAAHREDWDAVRDRLDEFESALMPLEDDIKTEIEKPAFDKKLQQGMRIIDVAKTLPLADEDAEAARREMDRAFDYAITAAVDRNFQSAARAFQQALDQAEIISARRVASREAFLQRQAELEQRFAEYRKNLLDSADRPQTITDALQDATGEQQAVAAAAEAEPQNWPAAHEALDRFAYTVEALDDARKEATEGAAFRKQESGLFQVIERAADMATVSDRATDAGRQMQAKYRAAMHAAYGKGKDYVGAMSMLREADALTDVITEEYNKSRLDPSMQAAFWTKVQQRTESFAEVKKGLGGFDLPSAVDNALANAEHAQAELAENDQGGEWSAAPGLLQAFEAEIQALIGTVTTEVEEKLQSFDTRFKLATTEHPRGKKTIRASAKFSTLRKDIEAKIKSQDVAGALHACETMDERLTDFESMPAPTDDEKAATVNGADRTIRDSTPERLAALPLEDRADLVFNLCAKGLPQPKNGTVPTALAALKRLYNASPPDPEFLKKRETQREAVVAGIGGVVADAGLSELFDAFGKADNEAWSLIVADRRALETRLQKICDAQTTALEMPTIKVTAYFDKSKPDNMGGYNWEAQDIKINCAATKMADLKEALVTVIHETFHAHQHDLVKKMLAGDIEPDHADFATAMMFLANSHEAGYLQKGGIIDFKTYIAQPQEADAEDQGKLTCDALIKQIAGGK